MIVYKSVVLDKKKVQNKPPTLFNNYIKFKYKRTTKVISYLLGIK